MDRDTIIEDVAEKAQLDSRTDAERATIETLQTFGQHVSAGEAEDLAAVLPDDLGGAVTSESDGQPDEFSPDEFATQLAEREGAGVDEDEAMVHARATMAAIAENGGRDALKEAREQLPGEFATLFETDELATG